MEHDIAQRAMIAPLSERGTTTREDIAETRRALTDFQCRGGYWRALAAHCGVPHQNLAALAAGTAGASSARCAVILGALPSAPLGQRGDRRLSRGLGEYIPAARHPSWGALATAMDRFWRERERMTPEERDVAWRAIGKLHEEYTSLEQRGRGWASYAVRAGVDSSNTAAPPALYRREHRRRTAGLVDKLSPRARELVNALLFTRRRAAPESLSHAKLRPCPRKTGLLNIREIDRDAFDAWPPRIPGRASRARRLHRRYTQHPAEVPA